MQVLLWVCIFQSISMAGYSQHVRIVDSSQTSSFRGLSVVNNKVVWVSGSKGTVGRSVDGGKNWDWMRVKGYEKTDFRDIEAFDKNTAIIMGVGSPAYILRTTDAGKNWTLVYENTDSLMFLDAMEFWNEQSGIVIGDPMNGRFFIGRTFDGGKTWRSIPEPNKPIADPGEACFAASGTNIRKLNKQEAIFVTGGLSAHVFIRDQKIKLPILQGTESTGSNSIAVKNSKTFMIVGGDFYKKDDSLHNAWITRDGGKSFTEPNSGPAGYRSCIEYLGKNKWISCGLSGVDYSNDDAHNFFPISHQSFHVVRKAKKGKAIFLAGAGGRIGVVEDGRKL